jgi:hypothetical protein
LSRTPASTTRARALLHRGKVYVRNKDGSEELYDHALDPAESRNLIGSHEQSDALDLFRSKMKEIDDDAVIAQEARFGKRTRRAHGRPALAANSSPWPDAHEPLPVCGPGDLDLHD